MDRNLFIRQGQAILDVLNLEEVTSVYCFGEILSSFSKSVTA